MSGSNLSFYPEEEGDVMSQSVVQTRDPGQLELLFRTCHLASSEGLSQLRLATDSARSIVRGESFAQITPSQSKLWP